MASFLCFEVCSASGETKVGLTFYRIMQLAQLSLGSLFIWTDRWGLDKPQKQWRNIGLVSPGAAFDCVTPIFPFKKTGTFFSHRYKVMTFQAVVSSQLSSSHIMLYSVLCKFSHIFFMRVSPFPE